MFERTRRVSKAGIILSNSRLRNVRLQTLFRYLNNVGRRRCPTRVGVPRLFLQLLRTAICQVPLPTGKLEPVQGTFFDFSQERSLGEVIDGLGGNPPGVDNCLVMVGTGDDGKSKVRIRNLIFLLCPSRSGTISSRSRTPFLLSPCLGPRTFGISNFLKGWAG